MIVPKPVSDLQTSKTQILELQNRGDARGLSFAAPPEALSFVGNLGDLHFAATKPGSVRGNHYHLRRREATIVLPGCKWSLYWAEDLNSAPQHREFAGNSAVVLLFAPRTAHAIRNDGEDELWLFAVQSETSDPADTVMHKLA